MMNGICIGPHGCEACFYSCVVGCGYEKWKDEMSLPLWEAASRHMPTPWPTHHSTPSSASHPYAPLYSSAPHVALVDPPPSSCHVLTHPPSRSSPLANRPSCFRPGRHRTHAQCLSVTTATPRLFSTTTY